MILRLPSLAALLAAALFLVPASAGAYERQWHVGASLGYATAQAPDATLHGFGGSLHATYGLTDAFNALGEISATAYPGGDLLLASGSAGVAYVFDVLRWVPYVGLMAGGYLFAPVGDACAACGSLAVGGSVPFGLDYQISREVAVGFAGRYHLLFGGEPSPGSHLTLFGRVEYVWGF